MKMRDLERRTGIGRETIRYYIRFGLLPEPVRPKRNVADYTDEHVRRLEVMLATSLGVEAVEETIAPDEAAAAAGLDPDELQILIRDGVVVERGAGGLSPLDVAIAKAWGKVKASGYNPDNGFFADDARLYIEALAPMARREIERFYGRLSGAGTLQDAARIGQAGIEHVNELISLIRTRLLLDLVAEMNARAG